MKKITCLLALFLCVIGTAMAQTQITDISQLSNDKKYTVWTARGGWAVNAAGDQFVSSNDAGLGTTLSADNMKNAQCQFQFLSEDGGTTIYLYSVSANKYVNKDCTLSATATDALTFNKQDDGTFVIKFDNSHYISVGNNQKIVVDGWSYADAGNKVTIKEVPDALVEVTWNYQIGDRTFKTITEELAANTACTAPAVDFFVADSQSADNTGSGETLTITVSGHENLPFVVTTDLNNAKWYAWRMHSSEPKFLSYNVENDKVAYANKTVTDYSILSDNAYFWCITGNLVDGFKLYNKAVYHKAVGTTQSLYYALGDPVMSDVDANNTWKLVKSAANSNWFCLQRADMTEGEKYMNLDFSKGKLSYWSAADAGSSIFMHTPASFPVNYVESYMNAPANAVGQSEYLTGENMTNARDALDAAQADQLNFSAATELATIATNVANGSFVEMAPGYYRLQNVNYGTYVVNGSSTDTYNNVFGGEAAANVPSLVGSVVNFVANGDNYTLYIQGKALGQCKQSTAVTLGAETNGVYSVTNNGPICTIGDQSHTAGYNYLHNAASQSNKVVGWVSNAGASQWYIVPATDLEVALHTVDGVSYASAYLPFPVQGEGIYTGTIDGNGSSLNMTAQKGVVPAKTGIVIKSPYATATLTIGGSADADVSDNSLKGTLTDLTGDLSNYLVLGVSNHNTGIGFFTPSENLHTIAANKAYLLAAEVSSASHALAMNFGGEATGVGTVITENGIQSNAPVFDLSGRRVMQTVKGGLYIQNGKKFIVK